MEEKRRPGRKVPRTEGNKHGWKREGARDGSDKGASDGRGIKPRIEEDRRHRWKREGATGTKRKGAQMQEENGSDGRGKAPWKEEERHP